MKEGCSRVVDERMGEGKFSYYGRNVGGIAVKVMEGESKCGREL
jgi:hypothetical protein